MRPVQLADIDVATRVLIPIDASQRCWMIGEICNEASIADKYCKRLRRPHPQFGTGTLMSAASRHCTINRPASCDQAYLECMRVVLEQLLKRGCHHVA